MAVVAAVIGTVLSVVGTVKSAKAQKKASRAREQQQRVATRKSRRQAIRASVIARSKALATAQGAGTINSSGVSGGVQSVGSRLGSELGFSTQMSNLSRDISRLDQRAATGQTLAGIGGTLFQFGANNGGLKPFGIG